MTEHNYEKGRLNLPFVGICTFGKYPYQENWDKISKPFISKIMEYDYQNIKFKKILNQLFDKKI